MPIGGFSSGNDQVVPEKCYRQFDVFEHRPQKTYGHGFEVANQLEVDGKVYRDFDEIIARHMEPIMSNLKKITQHKHYGLSTRQGKILDVGQVKKLLKEFSEESTMLNYKLLLHETQIGHGVLFWSIGGRKVKDELLEVCADGYRLLGSHFPNLAKAIGWFKSTGWRNASKLRQDMKQEWRVKREELAEKRGAHADPDEAERRKKTLRMVMGDDGLKTPGGLSAMGTPMNFTKEANARTPYGLLSNSGTPANAGPTTPGNPLTPVRGVRTPATPAAAFERSMPSTPFGLLSRQQPTTPIFTGGITPGQIVPQTPIGPGTPQLRTRDAVPQTPAYPGTPMRGTPSGNIVPQTPAAAFAGAGAPRTPAAAFPHAPPGTPTPVPQTPAMPEQEVKVDPGIVPTTPAR
mmetsp:Transcript_75371/g.92619  ORF Transcript_75371/g.92619 Transcript_75371/m.92619 type:complete len:404 (-) Transcript_75371:89-1300(-)